MGSDRIRSDRMGFDGSQWALWPDYRAPAGKFHYALASFQQDFLSSFFIICDLPFASRATCCLSGSEPDKLVSRLVAAGGSSQAR